MVETLAPVSKGVGLYCAKSDGLTLPAAYTEITGQRGMMRGVLGVSLVLSTVDLKLWRCLLRSKYWQWSMAKSRNNSRTNNFLCIVVQLTPSSVTKPSNQLDTESCDSPGENVKQYHEILPFMICCNFLNKIWIHQRIQSQKK
jgi:hypothetical protein